MGSGSAALRWSCAAGWAKPAWQRADNTEQSGCLARTDNDVSAVGDPNTGVWVFDSTPFEGQPVDWQAVGGTSASAPIIAGVYALAGIPDTIVEYGTDTSRAITRTVFSGTSVKYPDIRMIFSHAGGTMPFLNERLVNLAKTAQYATQLPKGFLAEAARFYYDTAQSVNTVQMHGLKTIVGASQIVFGTDYPFVTAARTLQGLSKCGFSATELQGIYRGTASKLLPKYS